MPRVSIENHNRRAAVSERLNAAFEECLEDFVSRYGDGSRRAKLRLARQLLGLTQREFAEAFGLKETTVRNWEADSRPEPRGVAGVLIDLIAVDPEKILEIAANGKPSEPVAVQVNRRRSKRTHCTSG